MNIRARAARRRAFAAVVAAEVARRRRRPAHAGGSPSRSRSPSGRSRRALRADARAWSEHRPRRGSRSLAAARGRNRCSSKPRRAPDFLARWRRLALDPQELSRRAPGTGSAADRLLRTLRRLVSVAALVGVSSLQLPGPVVAGPRCTAPSMKVFDWKTRQPAPPGDHRPCRNSPQGRRGRTSATSARGGCSTGEDLAQAFPIRIARRPQSDRAD